MRLSYNYGGFRNEYGVFRMAGQWYLGNRSVCALDFAGNNKVKNMRQFVIVSFFLGILIAGAACLAIVVRDYQRAAMSHYWPRVEATIIGNGVEGLIGLRNTHYIYVVDGRILKGRRLRFLINNRLINRQPARQFVSGQSITLHVQPTNAAVSIMNVDGSVSGFLLLLLPSALLLFLGAGGLWFSLSRRE